MSIKTKYSTRRKYIRMSLNKYNVFNIKTYYKINRSYKKKRLRIRSVIYKNKLLAKQRLRRFYGNLNEVQLKKLFRLALWHRNKFYKKYKSDKMRDYLLIYLERRLDAALFRLRWAPSIFASRQLINHGHILVNGNKITCSSFLLSIGDLISINRKSIKLIENLNSIKISSIKYKMLSKLQLISIPSYFLVNKLSAILVRLPKPREIVYPFHIKSNLINRFYKRVRY